jgi:diphosphomevalonate decarboxylase
MTNKDFIFTDSFEVPISGTSHWESPSNIALVKYWGKNEVQIPKNSSISFTLKNCLTNTKLDYNKKIIKTKLLEFDVFFNNKLKLDFKPKIQSFFERIVIYCPYILEYKFNINSSNSFPHSSGIASSASGISALALCIMSIEKSINPGISEDLEVHVEV